MIVKLEVTTRGAAAAAFDVDSSLALAALLCLETLRRVLGARSEAADA